jgi:hypothetical protein
MPLWPNLVGLELAPTTAKAGEEKKVRMVASVVMVNAVRESMRLIGWIGLADFESASMTLKTGNLEG